MLTVRRCGFKVTFFFDGCGVTDSLQPGVEEPSPLAKLHVCEAFVPQLQGERSSPRAALQGLNHSSVSGCPVHLLNTCVMDRNEQRTWIQASKQILRVWKLKCSSEFFNPTGSTSDLLHGLTFTFTLTEPWSVVCEDITGAANRTQLLDVVTGSDTGIRTREGECDGMRDDRRRMDEHKNKENSRE
ncbi:unnamed protein product [Pleuronectes platessa]|uniref:Uncharacterized protein n=1 Tax=Pleuronectes platessa TaxID=8262 RepID=A0A9N7TTF5_PLEPL|nr:unnamed protein product [Pleuronectes platessa]